MTTDTSPFTDDGALKITTTELEYMQTLLDHDDRGGFYMALYNMTGQTQALLQAQIATFSEGVGGGAIAANTILQSYYGPQGKYPGIYYLSQKVALSALDFIRREL